MEYIYTVAYPNVKALKMGKNEITAWEKKIEEEKEVEKAKANAKKKGTKQEVPVKAPNPK